MHPTRMRARVLMLRAARAGAQDEVRRCACDMRWCGLVSAAVFAAGGLGWFEKVLIGTRGARETFLRGREGRAAKNSVLASGAKQLCYCELGSGPPVRVVRRASRVSSSPRLKRRPAATGRRDASNRGFGSRLKRAASVAAAPGRPCGRRRGVGPGGRPGTSASQSRCRVRLLANAGVLRPGPGGRPARTPGRNVSP